MVIKCCRGAKDTGEKEQWTPRVRPCFLLFNRYSLTMAAKSGNEEQTFGVEPVKHTVAYLRVNTQSN